MPPNVAKLLSLSPMYKAAIIGAGASGCFCAVEMKRRHPDWDIVVLESAPAPLQKLAITGGGRCNLTNSFNEVGSLREVYPRGEQLMKRGLREFDQNDCMAWWEREGVRLVVQDDQCVFPRSQDAMQLVHTLERLMSRLGVRLRCRCKVISISDLRSSGGCGYQISLASGEHLEADRVVVSVGGCSSEVLGRILPQGVPLTPTVPSLFTLRLDDEKLRQLGGTVVRDATLSIAGTAHRSRGIVLITDWGVSGPATLRLSSYAARTLSQMQYKGRLIINWLSLNEMQTADMLEGLVGGSKAGGRQLANTRPEELTDRLWRHIIARSALRPDIRCSEIGSKGLSRLKNSLCADCYDILGRARFKEEFVTCGGVDLAAINLNTLEVKGFPGLFVTGEALDMDAVTGGFNLQAAWTTGYIAAK